MDAPPSSPLPRLNADWHQQQAALAEQAARGLSRRVDLIALARFCLLVLIVIAAAALFARASAIPILTILLTLGLWMWLALLHGLWLDERDRLRRLRSYHQEGIQRCTDAVWPTRHAPEIDPAHLYADDLDLGGPQGLLARMDTCSSGRGRRHLYCLFLDTDREWSRQRQQQVQALYTQDLWRSQLASAAVQEGSAQDDPAILDWAKQVSQALPPFWSWLAYGLSLFFIGSLILVALQWGGMATLGLAMLWIGLGYLIESRVLQRSAISQLDADREVARLQSLVSGIGVIKRLDTSQDPGLADLVRHLAGAEEALTHCQGLAAALARRANPLWTYGPSALLLSGLHLASKLHRWAQAHAGHSESWLNSLGSIDALSSLATWAAEQGGVWPEVFESSEKSILFEAEDLQHPLLPQSSRVGNPCLIHQGDAMLLTGANASGKSTWLRTIALAALLARSGTTVPALRCRMQELRLATVMRVHDDLAAGRSRFQAEVARLAACLSYAQQAGPPCLLIFDEILGGTNSQERHIGTEAIIRAHMQQTGALLLATHDLALAALSQEFPDHLQLAHFADNADALDQDLAFDYQIRPGVISSTNALRIMRAAGLPIGTGPHDPESN